MTGSWPDVTNGGGGVLQFFPKVLADRRTGVLWVSGGRFFCFLIYLRWHEDDDGASEYDG